MSNSNASLRRAKAAKNDEFYTQMADIEKELSNYTEHFAGKIVYCNCDDPNRSNFWRYFKENFEALGLKRVIATGFIKDGTGVGRCLDEAGEREILLVGDGDFRSGECLNLLDTADIVVTNPPFSLFREYVACLMAHQKQFLIVGNKNAITYKEFFPLLSANLVWLGCNNVGKFDTPDGTVQKFGNIGWFTNLDNHKRHEFLPLTEHFTEEKYPKYDNYDAVNVDRLSEIPCDYYGVMGVPITFLDHYCPEQFEIVAFRKGLDGRDLVYSAAAERERERERERVMKTETLTHMRGHNSTVFQDSRPYYMTVSPYVGGGETLPEDVRLYTASHPWLNGKELFKRITVRLR